MKKDWKFESRPEPGEHGQRFFTRVEFGDALALRLLREAGAARGHMADGRGGDRKLYICDNSGSNPGEAEDGPLYIDASRKIRVGVCKPIGVHATVPVLTEDGGGQYWCGVTPGELLWLISSGWANRVGGGIEFAPELTTLRKLFRALQYVPMPEPGPPRLPVGYDPSLEEDD